MNTLFTALDRIGFILRRDEMFWGWGAWLSAGAYITVRHEGKGYAVLYHAFQYDEWGDKVLDETAKAWFRRHSDVMAWVTEHMKR